MANHNAYLGLTSTYTPVNYVESNGTQYIDTGVMATQNTKVEISLRTALFYDSTCLFGTYEPSTTSSFSIFVGNVSSNNRVGNQSITRAASYWQNNTSYIISQDKIGQTVNSVLTNFSSTPADFSSTETLYLLYVNQTPGRNGNPYFSGRLYYAKIWENDVLVRDFIPVKDLLNNQGCLYDRVTGSVYYSEEKPLVAGPVTGGSDFSIPNKAKKIQTIYRGLTHTYKQLEYIQSDSFQYFDTGVPMKDTLKVEGEFMDVSGGYGTWYGARANVSSQFPGITTSDSSGNRRFTYSGTATGEYVLATPTIGAWHTVSHGQQVYLDGNFLATLNAKTFSLSNNLYIFCMNAEAIYRGSYTVRMKWFKVYDNNVLIRDFIPVLDVKGVPCLLDKVEGKLYYNIGYGSCTVGSEVPGAEHTVSNRASIISKVYVGKNDVAKLCFKRSYNFEITKRLVMSASRGHSDCIASTENHLIVAGGENNIGNYIAFDRNYVQTTSGQIGYYSSTTGRTFLEKTMWIMNSSSATIFINDDLTYTTGNTYTSGSYGVGASVVRSQILFTGGYNNYAYAYGTSGVRTIATNMYASRYRHAQCSFNNRHCIVGGGSATMDVYGPYLAKTTATGLTADKRYINSAATHDYLICSQASNQIAVFDTNLTRLTALQSPQSINSNCCAANYKDEYIVFLNDKTHLRVDKNLLVEEINRELQSEDTYSTGWVDGGIAIAGQQYIQVYS